MRRLLNTVLIFVGVALAGLVVYGVSSVFRLSEELEEEGSNQLIALEALVAEQVKSVDIYGRYGEELLATTRDEAELSAFVAAAKGMVDWEPNHPSFDRHLYVMLRLKDGRKHEFKMCFMHPGDPIVYVYGVRKQGNTTYYLYRKKSAALAKWLRSQGVGI